MNYDLYEKIFLLFDDLNSKTHHIVLQRSLLSYDCIYLRIGLASYPDSFILS